MSVFGILAALFTAIRPYLRTIAEVVGGRLLFWRGKVAQRKQTAAEQAQRHAQKVENARKIEKDVRDDDGADAAERLRRWRQPRVD